MKHSDSIEKIAPAFAKAQALFVPPLKDSHADAGKFGYSYADLANVFEGAKPGLVPNGLFLFAVVIEKGSGHALETVLMHESGEYFSMEYPINMTGTPQVVGSAITYARRYSAMMILGLAGEDDDGAAASAKKPMQPQKAGSSGTTTQATTTKSAQNPQIGTRMLSSSATTAEINQAAHELADEIEASTAAIERNTAIAFKKRWTDKLNAALKTHPENAAMLAKVAADNQAKSDTPTDEIIARAKRIMVNVCNTTGEIEESAPGE